MSHIDNFLYHQLLTHSQAATSVAIVQKTPTYAVLVARRLSPPETGRLSFPGGKLKYGEEPQRAALREIVEEVGIHIPISKLYPFLFSTRVFLHSHLAYLSYLYLTFWTPMMGIPQNLEPDKHEPWQWMSFEALLTEQDGESLSLVLNAFTHRLIENAEAQSSPRKVLGEWTVTR